MARNVSLDIRDSEQVTWKDVVVAALEQLQGNCSLEQIYAEIDGHKKTESNEHWKDKVRQVLQQLQNAGVTVNTSRGMWAMAA